MKKKIRFLSAFLVSILLVSALMGCNKTPTGTETQTPPVTSPLTINGVALKEYTVVYNKRPISGAEDAFSYLNKKIEELCDTTLQGDVISADRYEILIGLDGDNGDIAQAYEQNPDGLIGATEKKIVLLGVNYGALCQVIDAFLDKATEVNGIFEISITECEFPNANKASLNIMSYNILMDLNKTGRPSDPRSKMVSTILANDTDVFGTQEDNNDNGNVFFKKLGAYSYYKGANEENNGNYIYWKTDRFNLLKKGFYYLSDTPEIRSKFSDSKHYRTMTYVILEDKETGKQFLFVDTHLQNNNTEGSDDTTRKKQLVVLTSLIKQINVNSLPVIIMGDFNTSSDAVSVQTFKRDNPNLGETIDIAVTKGDIGKTFANNFKDRTDTIDHIFVSTDRIYTKYFSVIDNKTNGKYPSDHLPLLAQIDIY